MSNPEKLLIDSVGYLSLLRKRTASARLGDALVLVPVQKLRYVPGTATIVLSMLSTWGQDVTDGDLVRWPGNEKWSDPL